MSRENVVRTSGQAWKGRRDARERLPSGQSREDRRKRGARRVAAPAAVDRMHGCVALRRSEIAKQTRAALRPARQKDAVRFALDAGATLVIGAHPHVIGPTKKVYSNTIKDTAFVAYSLGNFLSNQYWRYTDAGVILKLIIQKNHTKKTVSFKEASFLPTWVYRGDGTKKVHILFPAQWGLDSTKLPNFLTNSHQQKMIEAFDDTKKMMTKTNSELKLNLAK